MPILTPLSAGTRMSTTGPPRPPSLRRELGTLDATAIYVGCVLGSGIFVVPSQVAVGIDSPLIVLGFWVIGGAICLAGSLSIAELSAAYSGAGGLYSILRVAYGDLLGFLYGWTTILLINTAVVAALALVVSQHAAGVIPSLGGRVLATAVVVLLALVNCLGLRPGKWMQNLLTAAKLAGIGIIVVLVFRRVPLLEASAETLQVSPTLPTWSAMGGALMMVVWTFDGWTYLSFTGDEVRSPQRTLPRGFMYGAVVAVLVYLLLNAAYYSALDGDEIRSSSAVAAAAVGKLFGEGPARLVAVLVIVSIVGSLNAMFLTAPRCLAAMGRDHLFFRTLAGIHWKTRTPVAAILLQGALATLFVWIGGFYQLLSMTVAAAWLFNAAAALAVFILRHRHPERPRPFQVPGYPWVPAFFCASAILIVAGAVTPDPKFAALGALIVLSGIPIFIALRGAGGGAALSRSLRGSLQVIGRATSD